MWFLYLLSWISTILQICFITLSIAAGLFYLAELVEEYTVLTGKVIKYLLWITTAVFIGLLCFENLPSSLIISGLVANGVYFAVLKTFPVIELSAPTFILSIVMIIINHYLAFKYFASTWHPFQEVLAYFTICLWLLPFAFFISLSANENVLPTTADLSRMRGDDEDGDLVSNYFARKATKYNLRSFLKSTQDTLLPQRTKKGY